MKGLSSNISDDRLMELISISDEQAFHILFERYWEDLYVIAKAILQDSEIAKDLVQDVFISFWQKRQYIVNDNIKGYLKQAIRNSVFKHLRDNKFSKLHEELIVSIPDKENILDILDFNQTDSLINEYLNELPDRCREVFLLSRKEQLSNTEIAEKLGLSKRTVETHISNALKILRPKLKPLFFILLLVFLQ